MKLFHYKCGKCGETFVSVSPSEHRTVTGKFVTHCGTDPALLVKIENKPDASENRRKAH